MDIFRKKLWEVGNIEKKIATLQFATTESRYIRSIDKQRRRGGVWLGAYMYLLTFLKLHHKLRWGHFVIVVPGDRTCVLETPLKIIHNVELL